MKFNDLQSFSSINDSEPLRQIGAWMSNASSNKKSWHDFAPNRMNGLEGKSLLSHKSDGTGRFCPSWRMPPATKNFVISKRKPLLRCITTNANQQEFSFVVLLVQPKVSAASIGQYAYCFMRHVDSVCAFLDFAS